MEKNVSSPEDIILSEHVEESLPRELCDIPWQFVVTVITCDTFLFTHSKTCCQTSLEHFYTFISTGCEKVEEVFESLTTKWFPIMRYIHPLRLPVFFTMPVELFWRCGVFVFHVMTPIMILRAVVIYNYLCN
jgi:hypothetical protein